MMLPPVPGVPPVTSRYGHCPAAGTTQRNCCEWYPSSRRSLAAGLFTRLTPPPVTTLQPGAHPVPSVDESTMNTMLAANWLKAMPHTGSGNGACALTAVTTAEANRGFRNAVKPSGFVRNCTRGSGFTRYWHSVPYCAEVLDSATHVPSLTKLLPRSVQLLPAVSGVAQLKYVAAPPLLPFTQRQLEEPDVTGSRSTPPQVLAGRVGTSGCCDSLSNLAFCTESSTPAMSPPMSAHASVAS